MLTNIKEKLLNIISNVNATTGNSDTTLITATNSLIEGYGSTSDNDIVSAILSDTVLEIYDEKTTKLRDYIFYASQNLSSIDLPNCVSVGQYALYENYSLNNINLPSVTNVGESALSFCSDLKNIEFPELTTVERCGFWKVV